MVISYRLKTRYQVRLRCSIERPCLANKDGQIQRVSKSLGAMLEGPRVSQKHSQLKQQSLDERNVNFAWPGKINSPDLEANNICQIGVTPMVKWLSCLPSKQAARVRFPFGVLSRNVLLPVFFSI